MVLQITSSRVRDSDRKVDSWSRFSPLRVRVYTAKDAFLQLYCNGSNKKSIRLTDSARDICRYSKWTLCTDSIIIKNLDKAIDREVLHSTFEAFGSIRYCTVATDESGQSKGVGFVQFSVTKDTELDINRMNGKLINGKIINVVPFIYEYEIKDDGLYVSELTSVEDLDEETVSADGASNERKDDGIYVLVSTIVEDLDEEIISADGASNERKDNSIYVKNLLESTTEDDLKNEFGEFGEINSAVILRDANGKSKCSGFMNFKNADDAARAIESLNGKKIDNREWYVAKAQNKTEREHEKKIMIEERRSIFVKNLDHSIKNGEFKKLFSRFGEIISSWVTLDRGGNSKGYGLVNFSTSEAASQARKEMHGKPVGSKSLHVEHTQTQEERKALRARQAQNSQSVNGMTTSVGSHMSMDSSNASVTGQQFLCGEGAPDMIPPLLPGGIPDYHSTQPTFVKSLDITIWIAFQPQATSFTDQQSVVSVGTSGSSGTRPYYPTVSGFGSYQPTVAVSA